MASARAGWAIARSHPGWLNVDGAWAEEVASRFSLGPQAVLAGPEARGEQGEVWKLTTALGAWAVKRLLRPLSETEAEDDAGCEEAARAAGVPTPAPTGRGTS